MHCLCSLLKREGGEDDTPRNRRKVRTQHQGHITQAKIIGSGNGFRRASDSIKGDMMYDNPRPWSRAPSKLNDMSK